MGFEYIDATSCLSPRLKMTDVTLYRPATAVKATFGPGDDSAFVCNLPEWSGAALQLALRCGSILSASETM